MLRRTHPGLGVVAADGADEILVDFELCGPDLDLPVDLPGIAVPGRQTQAG